MKVRAICLRLAVVLLSIMTTWVALEYGSMGVIYLYRQVKGEDLTGGMGIRWIHPVFSGIPEEKVVSIWHPYRTYANPANVENRIYALSTDQYGFTHTGTPREYLIPKPPEVKRLILIGGSAAEGHGASSNSTTIAAELQRLLDENQTAEFEVINAGVGGYASISELIYLIVDLMRFEPDYVITFDGYNDIWLAMELFHERQLVAPNYSMYQFHTSSELNWWRWDGIGTFTARQRRISLLLGYLAGESLALIKKRLFPYSTAIAQYTTQETRQASPEQTSSDFEDSLVCDREVSRTTAEHYLRNMRMLAAISAGNDVRTILTVQPHYILTPSLDGHPFRDEGYLECFLDYYDSIQEGVLELGDRDGDLVRAMSFVPIFEELGDEISEVFKPDGVHLHDQGQAIVAQEMYSNIAKFESESQ